MTTVALPAQPSLNPQAVAFSGDRAFVCTNSSGTPATPGIAVLDPPYTAVSFVIPLARGCGSVAVSPDGETVLVTVGGSGNPDGNGVAVFRPPFSALTTPRNVLRVVSSGVGWPAGLVFTPDGTKALLTVFGESLVYVLPAPFSDSAMIVPILFPAGVFPAGSSLQPVISPDGQLLVLNGATPLPFIRAPFGTDPPPALSPVRFETSEFAQVRFPIAAQSIGVAAAILPSSRAVQVGQTATVFATLLAAGTGTATGCTIAPVNAPAGTAFTYQRTNAQNAPIGEPNTPVDIPGGEGQSFVLALTPSQTFAGTDIRFAFDCTNTEPVGVIPDVNTLLLTATIDPTPDIVALAATASNDGIVTIPVGEGRAWAVASVNVGVPGTITISVDAGNARFP